MVWTCLQFSTFVRSFLDGLWMTNAVCNSLSRSIWRIYEIESSLKVCKQIVIIYQYSICTMGFFFKATFLILMRTLSPCSLVSAKLSPELSTQCWAVISQSSAIMEAVQLPPPISTVCKLQFTLELQMNLFTISGAFSVTVKLQSLRRSFWSSILLPIPNRYFCDFHRTTKVGATALEKLL